MTALILVVDDDPDTCALLKSAIEREGDRVLLTGDADTGLASARAARPDLIFMDAVMPGRSGFEACREIKADPTLANIPVVFMTGLTDTEHVIEGFGAGGVDYITKPVVLDELLARMNAHLANARAAQSARVALDITGRAVLTADAAGRVIWWTPQASTLLGGASGVVDVLSAAISAMLASAPDAGTRIRQRIGVAEVELILLGRAARDEYLLRVLAYDPDREQGALRSALGLTAREADVLLWIARGKSNRDTSEILDISPRTVNKHLEQIFEKLGVENRAAAAAAATKVIAALG